MDMHQLPNLLATPHKPHNQVSCDTTSPAIEVLVWLKNGQINTDRGFPNPTVLHQAIEEGWGRIQFSIGNSAHVRLEGLMAWQQDSPTVDHYIAPGTESANDDVVLN